MAGIDLTADTKRTGTGPGDNRPASERFGEQASAVSHDIQGIGAIVQDMAHEKIEELQENATAAYQQGRDQVQVAKHALERFIEEKPLTSVLIAAGAGLLLGRFWLRS